MTYLEQVTLKEAATALRKLANKLSKLDERSMDTGESRADLGDIVKELVSNDLNNVKSRLVLLAKVLKQDSVKKASQSTLGLDDCTFKPDR